MSKPNGWPRDFHGHSLLYRKSARELAGDFTPIVCFQRPNHANCPSAVPCLQTARLGSARLSSARRALVLHSAAVFATIKHSGARREQVLKTHPVLACMTCELVVIPAAGSQSWLGHEPGAAAATRYTVKTIIAIPLNLVDGAKTLG